MAAVFSRRSMRVRCATQRDHVFHPEMNYSQTQLDQLDRLTERWVADHLQKGKTSKKDKELVTLEYLPLGFGRCGQSHSQAKGGPCVTITRADDPRHDAGRIGHHHPDGLCRGGS